MVVGKATGPSSMNLPWEIRLFRFLAKLLPHTKYLGGRLSNVFSWYLRWRKMPRITADFHEFTLAFDPHQGPERAFLICPNLMECEEQRFMREFLAADDVFVDIGANLGIYSLFASRNIRGNLGGQSSCLGG